MTLVNMGCQASWITSSSHSGSRPAHMVSFCRPYRRTPSVITHFKRENVVISSRFRAVSACLGDLHVAQRNAAPAWSSNAFACRMYRITIAALACLVTSMILSRRAEWIAALVTNPDLNECPE